MGDLNELPIGGRARTFPAQTVNTLIKGERRDRAKAGETANDSPISRPQTPVIAKLLWDGEEDLPPGNTVKLGNAVHDPTVEGSEHAPFAGLFFRCSAFGGAEELENYAITLGPIAANGVGYGILPEAWWARLLIGSNSDTHATIQAAGTLLQSATSAGLPIIWKPTATDPTPEDPIEAWAVVRIAGSGGGTQLDAAIVKLTENFAPAPNSDEHNYSTDYVVQSGSTGGKRIANPSTSRTLLSGSRCTVLGLPGEDFCVVVANYC